MGGKHTGIQTDDDQTEGYMPEGGDMSQNQSPAGQKGGQTQRKDINPKDSGMQNEDDESRVGVPGFS